MLTNIKVISSVVCLMALTNLFQVSQTNSIAGESVAGLSPPVSLRQNSIPVLYVTGTHYEVGFNVGRTFGSMIKEFMSKYKPLQEQYLPLYNTKEGKQIYEESLASTKQFFPQYLIELQGMADGAGVPFEELFLMALDDTLPKNMDTKTERKEAVGCTSIIVNQQNTQLLGHTEDALSETINNYYILAAHIVPGENEINPLAGFPAREEKFEALTYAGHLSGYASGHNYHGLVFSINTIFVEYPLKGRIPREFLTRALLSTKPDLPEILKVLTNRGVGTADGFNVNVGFLDVPAGASRVFHTIEVTPSQSGEYKSDVHVTDFPLGSNSIHTNRLLHLKYPELNEDGYQSSIVREARYQKLTSNKPITSVEELLTVLGNKEDNPYPIFIDRPDARESTINLGVFDFDRKTWTMWPNDPLETSPLLRLPLSYIDLVSETKIDVNTNKID